MRERCRDTQTGIERQTIDKDNETEEEIEVDRLNGVIT